jgi:hypothetical protein
VSTLWWNRLPGIAARPAPRGRRARPCIEALDRRIVPAIFSGLVNGQLQVVDGSAAETITLDHVGSSTIVNGASFDDAAITKGIKITAGTGVGNFDTVNIRATVKPVTVDGQFDIGTATVGADGSVQGVLAPVTFTHFNGALTGNLIIDDSADPTGRTVTMDVANGRASVAGLSTGTVFFDQDGIDDLTVKGGGGGNTFEVLNTPSGGVDGLTTIDLQTGVGQDLVHARGVTAHTTLFVEGQSGRDSVVVGDDGSTAKINGLVQVNNRGSFTDLTVVDSVDATPRNVSINNRSADVNFRFPNLMFIDDLGPSTSGEVAYDPRDVSTVTVDAGPGGNQFEVDDRGRPPTSYQLILNTGSGSDFVRVLASESPLTINGQNGSDLVNVSSDIFPAGTMQNILADVTVTNKFAFTQLTLNDAANPAGLFAQIDMPNDSLVKVSGLAQGNIFYNPADVSRVNINGSNSADTFLVSAVAGGPVQINALGGDDRFIVGSASNLLDPIKAALTLNGNSGFDTLTINDQGSKLAHVYNLTATSFTRSFNGPSVNIGFSPFESIQLNKGAFVSSPPLARNLALRTKGHSGNVAALTGRLWDSDKGDVLSLIVDWGDGSDPAQVTPNRAPFRLSHRYAAPGTYTVRAIWTDSTGQSNFRDLALTVSPPPTHRLSRR